MKSLLKEPLLHFLLLGGILLFGYSLVGGEPSSPSAGNEITLSAAKLEQLSYAFEKTHQRQPDKTERNALIENYFKEETAYKKGLAMGLLEGDALIKKRIRQKLEFIVEDAVATIEPSHQQLQDFLAERVDDYRSDEIFNFEQVYLNPQKYADIDAEMDRILDVLQNQKTAASLGDSIFLEPNYTATAYWAIARDFGSPFADRLKKLTLNQWHKGIKSGYGIHLVKITKKHGGEPQSLGQVKEALTQEWQYQQRDDAMKVFYESLFKEYDVQLQNI